MRSAESISVTMTPQTLQALRDSVAAGESASVSAALRAAVRLWQTDRQKHAASLVAIRARIRRLLEDPRPDLTSEQMEVELQTIFDEKARPADEP